jgi:DNA-binding CsgD family transcriptional regulator
VNTVLEAGTRPLHGRSTELSALRHAIRSVHRAGSVRISFESTPGMGKSRLLTEAGTLAEASGARVIRGLHEDHEEFDRPLVVLLDDIHCSDASDVRRLADVRVKAACVPTVWCTSRRWGRPNSPLDVALGSMAGPHRLFRLGALDDRAAQEMAYDLLGRKPDAALARIVASVSGHPQALRVLVEGLLDEDKVEVGATARLTHSALPERFDGLVRRYLQDCSPSCAHMLFVASVLGTHLSFGELAEALGVKPSRLLPDLQEAVFSGLLSEDGDDVRFANELFRRVVLNSVPATARAAVREQVDQHRARQFGETVKGSGPRSHHAAFDFLAKPVRGPVELHQLKDNVVSSAAHRAPEAVGRLSGRHAASTGSAFLPVMRDMSEDGPAVPRHAERPGGTAVAVATLPEWDRLTEKQVVIAELAVEGLTNKEIAERLYVSPHTVNYHLRKIFQALSIRSRTELIRIAHAPSPSADPLSDVSLRPDTEHRRRGAA